MVKTDEHGFFFLPTCKRDKFIFITTPSGYRCIQFYQPNKGEDYRYNFALVPYATDETFSFIHISDTETADSSLWVKMLKEYAANQGSAFLIHTGDICYEDGLRMHAELVNSKTMGLPIYYAIGNHDLVVDDYGEQLYESLFGPVYYSFDVGNVHFIVTPMPGGDYKPQYTQEDVYRWLKNDLAQVPKNRPKVVFNHDLLRTKEGFVYRLNEKEVIDLEDYNLKAWVYGHWHNHYYRNYEDSEVISICTSPPNKGGIDHSIAAFRDFTVREDGSFSTELIESFVDHQLTIAAPAPFTQLSAKNSFPVLVNAFNTTAPTKSVSIQIEGMEPSPLKQVSDWSWLVGVPYPPEWKEKDSLHLKVTGEFSDGTLVEEERYFQVFDFIPTSTQEKWPNFLMNAQHAPQVSQNFSAPLKLNWIAYTGSNIYHCSPVVADGKVFITSIDEGDSRNNFVYAFDCQTGASLWHSPTRSPVKHTLAYDDGIVVATDLTGQVYAFDAETGKLVWEYDLQMDIRPTYVGGVTIHNGIAYTGDAKYFSALRVADGQLLWQSDQWPQNMGGPATPAYGEGVIVASSNWCHLYAFDAETGESLWSNDRDGLRFRNAPPVYAEGHFYTTSKNSIFKIAPRTGEILYSKETPYNLNSSSAPALTDKLLIVGTVDAGLRAFDRNTFEEIWHFNPRPSLTVSGPYAEARVKMIAASPVISGGKVYVGGLDGYFCVLDAQTGKTEWETELGAPIFSTVAIADGQIFISDYGGNIYSFSGKKEK